MNLHYETTSKKITNSYEAAYYFMCGAEVVAVSTRRLPPKKLGKHGFNNQWIITMENIPAQCIRDWRDAMATGSLRQFADARLKLKRKIKELIKY